MDQVSIPATTGEFGVLPGHVATIAQMKPGVLAVHLEADKNVKKVLKLIPAPQRPIAAPERLFFILFPFYFGQS